jgi:hypothetical protein
MNPLTPQAAIAAASKHSRTSASATCGAINDLP